MSKKRGNRWREKTDDVRFIDPERTWFVARILPARDAKAAQKLAEAGVDVWMPIFRATITRRNKKVEVERRFFASYLFVGLAPNERGELPYRDVLDCEHVIGMLGNEKPAVFPVTVLQAVAERLAGQDRDETEAGRRKEAAARFDIGAFHKVIGGPFSTLLCEIVAVLDTGRIKADVDIFGRKTPVEFEPYDLCADAA